MRRAANTKNEYQQRIRTYKQRREELQVRFNYRRGIPNPAYSKAVHTINNRISTWNRAIRRIEKRQEQLLEISKLVEEFTSAKVRFTLQHRYGNTQLARNLFFKYAMEQGFSGSDIAYHVGAKCRTNVHANRLRFSRSFKTNEQNLTTWRKFSGYMQSNYKPIK